MGSVEKISSLPPWDQVIVDIKNYVYHYQIDSPETMKKARTSMLDAIGCSILAVSTSPECRKLLGPYVPGTTVKHGFRLPGTSFVLDPLKGAFDFATAIRYLDYNDCFGGADFAHPSDNFGAILAIADYLCQSNDRSSGPPLTMRTLLEAMIKAYEIQGTFISLNSFNTLGLDHTIIVELASTAVVSWLMGLSEEQAMAAISHVFMDGCPLRVFRASTNTIPRKGWAAGDACLRAVQLAFISRTGQQGAHTPLTMPRWGFYANTYHGNEFKFPPESYNTFVMDSIAYKLFPVEGYSLFAIQAMKEHAEVLRARGLDPDRDVKKIKVRATRPMVFITDKPGDLHNPADRDHSLQYILGLVLLKNDWPEVHDYRDDSPWASDKRMLDMRSKFEVTEDAGFTAELYGEKRRGYPSPPVAGITIVLQDDTELKEIVSRNCPGCVHHPDTESMAERKFRQNMKFKYSSNEIDKIIALAQDEDLPISFFVQALVRND